MSDERERDEQAMAAILDRLDRDISRAEDEYFLKTLDKLDRDILKCEEEAVLNWLERDIAKAEAKEAQLPPDSVVTHLEQPQNPFSNSNKDSNEDWVGLENKATAPRFRRRKKKKRYENVERASVIYRKEIPKYLDRTKQPVLTRGQFQTGVLDGFEQEMDKMSIPKTLQWKAHLHETCPNNPNAYLLEVSGLPNLPQSYHQLLDILRNKATEWIRYRVHMYNAFKLFGDGESLLFDLVVPVGESFGARFKMNVGTSIERKYAPQDGIWMTGIRDPTIGLAKSMGSAKPFEAGFAIVAINDEPCTTAEKLVSMAKKHQQDKKPSKVTVCLSKYGNFEGLDLSKLGPRRRDLKPFSLEYYKSLANKKTSYRTPIRSLPWTPPNSKAEMQKFSDKLMDDDNSIEVSVILSASDGRRGLGATFIETSKGLWTSQFDGNGQLRKIFGDHPCTWGFLLSKANGVALKDIEALQEVIELAKPHTFRATFVLFDGTDLGGLDNSYLVQGRVNPRRTSGEPYFVYDEAESLSDEVESLGSSPGRAETETDVDDNVDDDDDDDGVVTTSNKKKRNKNANAGRPSKRLRIDDDDKVEGIVNSSDEETHMEIDKKANYDRFKEKYKPFVEMEYGGTDISNIHALSSMWNSHKRLFGEEHLCNDQCKCFASTKKLSRNVIQGYMMKQKKKEKPVGLVQTAGIADHFAPRFLPKLKQEYPKMTPSELIQRLADMWRIHKMHSRFGMRCTQNCECNEEWEQLFCKGDIKKAEETMSSTAPSLKRRRPDTQSDQNQPKIPRMSGTSIPRKGATGLARSFSTQKTYEISFDTHSPLGAFFTTKEGKCKVHSIYSKGQLKKDARLAPGTIVDSAIIGGVRNKIKSHAELEDIYLETKKKPDKKLQLVFINTDVASKFAQNKALPQKDWTGVGAWQGKELNGWAGGAPAKNQAPRAKMPPPIDTRGPVDNISNTVETNDRKVAAATRPIREPASLDHELPDQNEKLTTVASNVVPAHRSAPPPKSILGGAHRGNAKVNFMFSNNERIYDTQSLATEWIGSAAEIAEQATTGPDVSQEALDPPEKALVDAIELKTYKELIDVLEAGCVCVPNVACGLLDEQYDKVKTALRAVQNELARYPSDPLLNSRKIDLSRKKTILNIYINACLEVENSMSLASRVGLEIRIRSLVVKNASKVPVRGRSNVTTGDVKVRVHHKNRPQEVENVGLGSIPPRQSGGFIDYGDDERGSIYTTTFSRSHQLEHRELVIDVYEGLPQDHIRPLPLAFFSIPLAKIDDLCKDNSICMHREAFIDPDAPLSKVEINLAIRRCRVPSLEKKAKIQEKIAQLLQFVARFNEEGDKIDKAGFHTLTANIQCYGNVSLLHAAVELCDEQLVEKLVALGANPLGKSRLGSAITRALKLRDRAEEKWANKRSEHENRGTDPAGMNAQKKVLDAFNYILRILRQHTSNGRVPQKYLFKEDESADNSMRSSGRDSRETANEYKYASLDQGAESRSDAAYNAHAQPGGREQHHGSSRIQKSSRRPSWEYEGSNDEKNPVTRRSSWNSAQVPASSHAQEPSWEAYPTEKGNGDDSCETVNEYKYASLDQGAESRSVAAYNAQTQSGGREQIQGGSSQIQKASRRPSSWEHEGYNNERDRVTQRSSWSNAQGPASAHAQQPSRGACPKEIGNGNDTQKTRQNWRYTSTNPSTGSVTSKHSHGLSSRENCGSAKDHSSSHATIVFGGESETLPAMKQDWLEKIFIKRCHFGDKCKFAALGICRFWHVEPRIRGSIPSTYVQRYELDTRNIFLKNISGWFTVAYTEATTKRIYYAQGGEGWENESGVYWYRTESAALSALKAVVAWAKR